MEITANDYEKYFRWLKTPRVVEAYFNHRFKSDKLTIVGDLDLSNNEYIKELVSVKSITGHLNLVNTPIKSLGNLESVGGNLNLVNTPIKSLGNLESVDGYLYLYNTPIKSLGNLESVGGTLNLYNTPIESLGNLESVGGYLYLYNTPISEKMTESEIRKMVNVKGNVVIDLMQMLGKKD